MKDFLERLVLYFPRYIEDLGRLFIGPKAFVRELDMAAEKSLEEACIFLTISLVASFLLFEFRLFES
jgi:hypothetical protein